MIHGGRGGQEIQESILAAVEWITWSETSSISVMNPGGVEGGLRGGFKGEGWVSWDLMRESGGP